MLLKHLSDVRNTLACWNSQGCQAPIRKRRGGTNTSKGEGRSIDPGNDIREQRIIEHHGVMFIHKKERGNSWAWYNQISGRLMQIAFRTGDHRHERNGTTYVGVGRQKQGRRIWNTESLLEQKKGTYHIVVRDLITRQHTRLENETNVLGPHIFW